MIIEKIPEEFKRALPILNTLKDAGYEAYFVGGSVRDTLLGLPIHDVDIATSAYPEEVKQIFNKTVDTGIEHGTVMVLDHGEGYEITTFRTESTYQDYRRPEKVEFVRSLQEDLKRRDLTINALAMDATGEIIDLFDGLTDLKKKVIRAVGDPNERFNEDALRMMRAVRFGSQLDFKMDSETFMAIKKNAHLLEKIAIERIHVEWVKLLLGKNPNQGIKEFLETNLYKYSPKFENKLSELKDIATMSHLIIPDEYVAWTFISYKLGYVTSNESGKLMKEWKLSNELIKHVQTALKCVEKIKRQNLQIDDYYQAGLSPLKTANIVAKLLGFGMDDAMLESQYNALPIKDKAELKINGGILIKKLNIKPGPQLGKILKELEKEVVQGNLKNNEGNLIKKAQDLVSTDN